MTSTSHPSFQWLRSQTLDSLNISVHEFQHKATGAQHIHMDADNNENVFLVALRTLPEDSSGVAHILEHTALCGSAKYPVRDPFFMMIRRSLNTFMNAFTSSDWTAYPFASQNRKDFDNLLDVYLDAVFFSRLDPLDFAQEGHRLDFAETGNPESPLIYKGVVFNEMKGAMSSVTSQLWQGVNKYLHPNSTYHHNSGGDPQAIPDLSYEQLKAFYQSHYHPSNAIFMTFGNISAKEHQGVFEDRVLQHFDKLDEPIGVQREKRYCAPIRVEEAYPHQVEARDENPANHTSHKKAHIVMAWLLEPSIDLKANLETHLLSSLLFDNSASPLQHLLETTDLGASPSPLCGMDDSQYEMLFFCGLADTDVTCVNAFETAVTQVLETIAKEGMPQAQIDASMHQLELRQREIGGDGYPYGLQLILNALSAATHRGDVLSALDLETSLQSLRKDIQQDGFVQQLVKRLLLNNQHRVTYTLRPDEQLQARQMAAETAALTTLKNNLSEAQKQAIIDQATALDLRQQQQDDNDILPKVTLDDIPNTIQYPTGTRHCAGTAKIHTYAVGSNGLSYQQRITPLPALSDEQLSTLPWYKLCLTEVGLGNQDYLAIQQRQSQVVGALSSDYSFHNNGDDPQHIAGYFTLSSKALNAQQDAMSQLMVDTVTQVRFDEHERLLELITQTRLGREQAITGSGHILAMQAASAHCSPVAKLQHQLSGLGGLQAIKTLENQLQQGNHTPFQQQLTALHKHLQTTAHQWLLISEQEQLDVYLEKVKRRWQDCLKHHPSASRFKHTVCENAVQGQAWITNSQVHFAAKAYPTVAMNHPDAAPLSVLGGVLRNGYLHRAIREQGGAYGGGASQDSSSGCFRFYSYRDPRMGATLDDFERSLDWLNTTKITDSAIEESILGIIGSLDKPSSPAGE
ncbi:MAG: insulinase family protein, partial [Cellvibrionaceae bacterium]|nr:insulinase family protein [Cellvibrionaceae bacterium]